MCDSVLNPYTTEPSPLTSFLCSALLCSRAALGQGTRLQDPVERAEAYSFCTLDGAGACSVLMFNPYGTVPWGRTADYLHLRSICCVPPLYR